MPFASLQSAEPNVERRHPELFDLINGLSKAVADRLLNLFPFTTAVLGIRSPVQNPLARFRK